MARARRAFNVGGRGPALLPLACVAVAAAALVACRQTVILDPAAGRDGGAGASAGAMGQADATAGGGAGGKGGWGGGAGGRTDGGRPETGSCFGGPLQPIGFALRAPDLILAVDRSAPMQTWLGTGTHLQAIQQQVLALILKYQSAVRFGYQEFPATDSTCSTGVGCCAGDVTPPTSMSLNAIQHVINGCAVSGGDGCVQGQRPLGDALARIERAYSSLNVSGRSRYVIVLTGGDPTCGGGSGDGGAYSACESAAKTVTNLSREQDVSTAIVGVGEGAAGSDCLDRLALNGGLGSVGKSPVYRLALTPNDIGRALNTLVGTMAEEACRIDVRSPVPDPSRVLLYVDNVLVPIDGADGWTFDPGTTSKITVHGSWCESLIQQPRNSIELLYGCPRP